MQPTAHRLVSVLRFLVQRGGGFKVPRVIANIEATDRAAYITPDAVSGDQNLYARQYREEIRTAWAA